MSYRTWQQALGALVKENDLQDSELGRIARDVNYDPLLEVGSKSSNGIAGAHGRLTRVSEILDRRQTDVLPTRDDGLNTYQGRLIRISLRLKGGPRGVFTLMASFDSQTAARLGASLCGGLGSPDMGGVRCSLTIVNEEPPTTSPSTSPKSRSDGT